MGTKMQEILTQQGVRGVDHLKCQSRVRPGQFSWYGQAVDQYDKVARRKYMAWFLQFAANVKQSPPAMIAEAEEFVASGLHKSGILGCTERFFDFKVDMVVWRMFFKNYPENVRPLWPWPTYSPPPKPNEPNSNSFQQWVDRQQSSGPSSGPLVASSPASKGPTKASWADMVEEEERAQMKSGYSAAAGGSSQNRAATRGTPAPRGRGTHHGQPPSRGNTSAHGGSNVKANAPRGGPSNSANQSAATGKSKWTPFDDYLAQEEAKRKKHVDTFYPAAEKAKALAEQAAAQDKGKDKEVVEPEAKCEPAAKPEDKPEAAPTPEAKPEPRAQVDETAKEVAKAPAQQAAPAPSKAAPKDSAKPLQGLMSSQFAARHEEDSGKLGNVQWKQPDEVELNRLCPAKGKLHPPGAAANPKKQDYRSRDAMWKRMYGDFSPTDPVSSPFEVCLPPNVDFGRLVLGNGGEVFKTANTLVDERFALYWTTSSSKSKEGVVTESHKLTVGFQVAYEPASMPQLWAMRACWNNILLWVYELYQGRAVPLDSWIHTTSENLVITEVTVDPISAVVQAFHAHSLSREKNQGLFTQARQKAIAQLVKLLEEAPGVDSGRQAILNWVDSSAHRVPGVFERQDQANIACIVWSMGLLKVLRNHAVQLRKDIA